MSPSPPSHVQQQQNRFSNSSSPVSSSQLSEDDDEDEGAPRSDAATVGSTRSVIGDILESSFASSMDPEHPPARSEVLSHETVASRHGQLPPLYPAAADSTASSTTATSLFARAGMHPPENRAQVMPPQRVGGVNVLLPRAATTTQTAVGGGSFEETSLQLGTHRSSSTDPHGLAMLPEASETGNSGAVATHTATKAGLGGGSQSGTSSIKSCGSIAGSEADERGESILTTVDISAAEQVAAAQNNTDSEDEHDCGGSLDVETHSVATIRSLHSQLFQEEHEDHCTTTDDAASAATATASNPASPRASPNSVQQEQQHPQGMALSQEDDRNEPLVDSTSMAGYARSRSPDRDESQVKSSRVRR